MKSTVSVDFRLNGDVNGGIYYPDSQRILIFVNRHESLEDIYNTIQHELIHHCLNILEERLDEDQEERLIFLTAWANESLV